MSFSSRELSVLAYANGFTLWHYRTADPLGSLLARERDGYFAAADELLRPGDQIMLSLTSGRLPAGAALVVTAVVPGRTVEVAPSGWPAADADGHITTQSGRRDDAGGHLLKTGEMVGG